MVNGKKVACPSCNRKFKTVTAMEQHRRATHGGATATRAAPARQRNMARVNRNTGLTVNAFAGTDFIKVIPIANAQSPGGNPVKFVISPRQIVSTRLQQVASLYARWRPTKLRLRVQCAGASTTFGSIAVGWCPDAEASPVAGPLNVSRILAYKPSAVVRLNGSANLSIPCEASRKWYLTAGPSDDTTHGSFHLCVSAQTGGYVGQVSVTVILDWACQFEGAELEPAGGDDDFVRPDSGYMNIFTTSDSSFDATVLTFKMHSGGAMVPFSAAHPARVYVPAGNTVVRYYEHTGVEKRADYFVRVQNYNTPGLVMFSSLEKAKDYIKTGDITSCLKYYKAGDWVTPAVPTFKAYGVSVAENFEIQCIREQVSELCSLFEKNNMATLTQDSASRKEIKNLLLDLQGRPKGTLNDPVKVFSEDPIRCSNGHPSSSLARFCSICGEALDKEVASCSKRDEMSCPKRDDRSRSSSFGVIEMPVISDSKKTSKMPTERRGVNK